MTRSEPAMSTPAYRRGFTLIEMLIVITIIAVLAALLIPAISLAKRELAKVRCSNNLQQLGMGIEVMRQEKDDLFPGRLVDLFDKAYSGSYERGLEKLMICPLDQSRGTTGFNRMSIWDQYDELREDKDDPLRSPARTNPRLAPCSYLYEASEQIVTSVSLMNKFFAAIPGADRPSNPSWAQAKKEQQRSGNMDASGVFGDAFPSSFFPVLRCYWHHKWTVANSRTDERMINLSWDLNVFKSIPYWETTVNPMFVP